RRGEGCGHLTQRAVSVSDPAAVVEERRAQHASSHRVDATVIPSTARDVYASFIVGWVDRATPTRSLARRHLPWYTPSAMPRADSVAGASVLVTGGGGFIGSPLVPRLRATPPKRSVVLDSPPSRTAPNL